MWRVLIFFITHKYHIPATTTMPRIAPSLLSADFSNLERELENVKEATCLHLDVMDGQFVPNITFGPTVIRQLRKLTDMTFDTHLMIVDPSRYLDDFIDAGSDIVTVHVEAEKNLRQTITSIKERGVKAGVSLNPATPLSSVEDILPELDLLLVMSVNPGFGGQKFMPSSLEKLKEARTMIDAVQKGSGSKVLLEIDGGVNLETIDAVAACGPDLIVAGSAIFKGDARKNFLDLSSHL